MRIAIRTKKHGLSLIEVLIVVSIVSLLIGLLIPVGSDMSSAAKSARRAQLQMRTVNGDYIWIQSGANTIDLDAWNMIAATYDGSKARLYVNGQLQDASTGYNVGTTETGSGAVSMDQVPATGNIGRNQVSSTTGMGIVDEVMILKTALSDAEIMQIYEMGKP